MMKQAPFVPKRLHVDRALGQLEIQWPDGEIQHLDLTALRKQCPCAVCEGIRERQAQNNGLHMITPDEAPSAVLTDIVAVGHYAVQFRWADGHDTGIYSYRYLKLFGRETIT